MKGGAQEALASPLEQILAIARSARISRQLEETKSALDAMPAERAALHEFDDGFDDGMSIGPFTVLQDDPEGDRTELACIVGDLLVGMLRPQPTAPPASLSLEERREKQRRELDKLRPLLIPGVVITHTRCLGIVEEHTFVRVDGTAICGHPTRDTALIRGSHRFVDDIAPGNVTHINREPIELWLDPDIGKIPEPVEYQPSPEQIMADRTLQLIEKNSIRDADAMSAIRDLLDEAGPDLAIEYRKLAMEGDVPW